MEIKKENCENQGPPLEALEDLIKCKICTQKLCESKMLPCQHTFCFKCLEKLFDQNKAAGKFACPTCATSFLINPNLSSPKYLPSNVYLESLIKLFYDKTNPQRNCMNCGVDSFKKFCDHCKQNFCEICWEEHVKTLKDNVGTLMEHVNELEDQLNVQKSKLENRCKEIDANIKYSIESQIAQLKLKEKEKVERLDKIKSEQDVIRQNLLSQIEDIKKEMEEASSKSHNDSLILNFHNQIKDIASQVSEFEFSFGLPTFDARTFTLSENNKTEPDHSIAIPNSIKTVGNYYSKKIWCPKLIWTKCPGPSGIGIPPWDESALYMTTQDRKLILIMNRHNLKITGTLSSPEMLFPHNLTFCNKRCEIYVSDKWKNCIHVFSKEGQFLRSLSLPELKCPGGIALYQDELVVSDPGNDSVIVLNPLDGTLISVLGMNGCRTEFLCPTSVAVYKERLIVADSGNYRIKVFNRSGEKLFEFGSMGKNKGQFKAMDVVTTDHFGFIFVGDSANKRIQIFSPDGKLTRVFNIASSVDKLSGLLVTPDFGIVVTDCKNKRLQIF